ncbi:uncharacterized protein J8A68_001256 [[Candida] subhashii]|uniref:Hyphally-regulated cell wall protein N-terminal domain-containing protein n=1 Tax=[Candida] subhashii TaxID=561895 RepID=A0A8J5R479_9ASCO|nr:uncharacterized protein J8A68_001256 [[Candida] subhashii]KAG7665200.1 hypothetical protein J8A68_001256 [[Candida] subhashii]
MVNFSDITYMEIIRSENKGVLFLSGVKGGYISTIAQEVFPNLGELCIENHEVVISPSFTNKRDEVPELEGCVSLLGDSILHLTGVSFHSTICLSEKAVLYIQQPTEYPLKIATFVGQSIIYMYFPDGPLELHTEDPGLFYFSDDAGFYYGVDVGTSYTFVKNAERRWFVIKPGETPDGVHGCPCNCLVDPVEVPGIEPEISTQTTEGRTEILTITTADGKWTTITYTQTEDPTTESSIEPEDPTETEPEDPTETEPEDPTETEPEDPTETEPEGPPETDSSTEHQDPTETESEDPAESDASTDPDTSTEPTIESVSSTESSPSSEPETDYQSSMISSSDPETSGSPQTSVSSSLDPEDSTASSVDTEVSAISAPESSLETKDSSEYSFSTLPQPESESSSKTRSERLTPTTLTSSTTVTIGTCSIPDSTICTKSTISSVTVLTTEITITKLITVTSGFATSTRETVIVVPTVVTQTITITTDVPICTDTVEITTSTFISSEKTGSGSGTSGTEGPDIPTTISPPIGLARRNIGNGIIVGLTVLACYVFVA